MTSDGQRIGVQFLPTLPHDFLIAELIVQITTGAIGARVALCSEEQPRNEVEAQALMLGERLLIRHDARKDVVIVHIAGRVKAGVRFDGVQEVFAEVPEMLMCDDENFVHFLIPHCFVVIEQL